MKLYDQVAYGRFLNRPNRFIAHVEIQGREEICHVKNTGRCRELLVPGAQVILAEGKGEKRKTRYDLVAVHKGNLLINMDSQAPNRAAQEALPRLFPGITRVQPEKTFGESRLDFYVETENRRIFVEVKGVTLEEAGVALFPDAPTERGIKHLRELEKCMEKGYEAVLLLVIQMKGVASFAPNGRTHPAFAQALAHAQGAGVQILAYDCLVTPDSMTLDAPVPVQI